ncbi:HNH endonuclease [Mycobacterium phage WillSterrel]|uniref:HNH endonuclease n=1 Tax=Mycobacterium phage WillSterrel TaxID=1897769 RepID=A0A1C9M082_9CAUD|nr:HNH endonuclease [Mycobacterium phage WillSterrel]AOQ28540.1 HNH endonuclease [Mycobacterium phage WillSterrel]
MSPEDLLRKHRAPVGGIPERVAKRAYDAWEADDDGCYISTYSTGSHGYSQIGWNADGRRFGTTGHRAAWVYVNGQIPEGMTIDHLPTCDRRCVNVDHLRMISNYENARRTSGRDWPLGECINGHPNSELYLVGQRIRCRPCLKAQRHERYLARKARERAEKLKGSDAEAS